MVPFYLLTIPSLMAAELTVGATGDYATIGDAVAAASAYDTITVQPGTYAETIWLAAGPTIQAEQGFGSVFIDGSGASGNVIAIAYGTVRGVIVTNAPTQGVQLQGDLARLEQSAVVAPGTVGVAVISSSPTITEVAVYDAGTAAFSLSAGSPVVTRCLAVDPSGAGFSVATPGSYDNLISVGGTPGFEVSADTDIRHLAALDSGDSGLLAHSVLAVSNALFSDNPLAADCQDYTVDLGHSLLYDSSDSWSCPAIGFHDNLIGAPRMTTWSSGRRPPLVDLSPSEASPMVDAGDGTDPDGSAADIGPFGGALGRWSDDDGDGVPIHFDCDDQDARANLHSTELHDGVDNDCDGEIDEVDPGDDTGLEPELPDIDADGYTELDGDCEDHNRATWPGAPELADGADNDCDGEIDEGSWYVDDDGDGYSELDGDCHDGDATRSPGVPEQGEDGIDHDCDGTADGNATADTDGDGWTVGEGDCDDSQASVHPDVSDELDGIDSDCDGSTDDEGLARDSDRDGVTVGELDCDDSDLAISPTSPELADDGIDQDCDGIDLFDVDGDGHPSPGAGGEDCDDARAETHPGATELCDGFDNDCDGNVDELCSDGELDGPPRDPWDPGIHGDCNCTSQPLAPQRLSWALLGLCLLITIRRHPWPPYA